MLVTDSVIPGLDLNYLSAHNGFTGKDMQNVQLATEGVAFILMQSQKTQRIVTEVITDSVCMSLKNVFTKQDMVIWGIS